MATIAAVILEAERATRHLSMKDPQRIAISDACDNLAQLEEALGGLDIGVRCTSKRRITAINAVLSSLEIAAGRLIEVAEIVEDETTSEEVMQ
jgi:hypothetical protein